MDINIAIKINALNGKPMPSLDGKVKGVTLRYVLTQVLLGTYFGDDKISEEEKIRRFNLAMKINDCPKSILDIGISDISYIKKLANISLDTYTFGRVQQLLPQ